MSQNSKAFNNAIMYGCIDMEAFAASVEESVSFKYDGPAMALMSLLSDAQHELITDKAQANQTINRVKFLIDRYVTVPRGTYFKAAA